MYNSSVPFTLEDLEADGEWRAGAQFVDLFSKSRSLRPWRKPHRGAGAGVRAAGAGDEDRAPGNDTLSGGPKPEKLSRMRMPKERKQDTKWACAASNR